MRQHIASYMKQTNNTIEIASKGLYSSWCYHKPSRTLFDCGEGVASYQGNYLYGVERICLSHGHDDHILGLPLFISIRNCACGERDKPLEIYYPADDWMIQTLIRYLKAIHRNNMRFEIQWKPIKAGDQIYLNDKQKIVAFEMIHSSSPTLGYKIIETRRKLKPEYRGQNISELLKSGVVQKENLHVEYDGNIFAYTLDSYFFESEHISGCELLVADCTFINNEDRTDKTHYSLTETYEKAKQASVQHLVAAHFSSRYLFPDIKNAIEKLDTSFITPVYHNTVSCC